MIFLSQYYKLTINKIRKKNRLKKEKMQNHELEKKKLGIKKVSNSVCYNITQFQVFCFLNVFKEKLHSSNIF